MRLIPFLLAAVLLSVCAGETHATAAASQEKIFFDRGDLVSRQIFSIDPDGSGLTQVTFGPTSATNSAVSPDGTKLAFDRAGDIWVLDLNGGGLSQITNDPANDTGATWSPDGLEIAFASSRDGDFEIFRMNSVGGSAVQLTHNAFDDTGPDWSPDGLRMTFSRNQPSLVLYVMNADGTGESVLYGNSAAQADWSPDGSKIAFSAAPNVSGVHIFVMNADGTQVQQLSSGPGDRHFPDWSPDGTHIVISRELSEPLIELVTMNSDGSGETQVTTPTFADLSPDWATVSPAVGGQVSIMRVSGETTSMALVALLALGFLVSLGAIRLILSRRRN